jgi:hypothetical protein
LPESRFDTLSLGGDQLPGPPDVHVPTPHACHPIWFARTWRSHRHGIGPPTSRALGGPSTPRTSGCLAHPPKVHGRGYGSACEVRG